MFLVGIAGFTLAFRAVRPGSTATMLIGARVLEAVTAAIAVFPQVLAVIRVEFAEDERPLAVGLDGTSMGFASILAQLLGGLLVSMNLFGWSWRLIFLYQYPDRARRDRPGIEHGQEIREAHAVPRWISSASDSRRSACSS